MKKKSAKSLVYKPQYASKVQRDRTKYRRKRKHPDYEIRGDTNNVRI